MILARGACLKCGVSDDPLSSRRVVALARGASSNSGRNPGTSRCFRRVGAFVERPKNSARNPRPSNNPYKRGKSNLLQPCLGENASGPQMCCFFVCLGCPHLGKKNVSGPPDVFFLAVATTILAATPWKKSLQPRIGKKRFRLGLGLRFVERVRAYGFEFRGWW